MSLDERFRQVTEIINGAGGTPFPVTDTLVMIVKELVREDELDFIMAFKDQKSQILEQLRDSSKLPDDEILQRSENLAKRGIVFNQPNRHGVRVYRLLPLINVGVFEYMFMQKLEQTEENKKIAGLFTKLFEELDDMVQGAYDDVLEFLKNMPAVDRTVPIRVNKATGKSTVIEINQNLGQPEDKILQTQDVRELVNKFDDIAVGHCFCRHHKDMEGKPCKQTDMRENCFTFGKSARFTSEQGFMRIVDKSEAIEILLKSEEDGLIHKAYHPNFNINKDETSVCNCCKCCCPNSLDSQIGPIVNVANFMAKVDADLCTGCETCVEACHTEAIMLSDDNISYVNIERCIGCGVCAYFCPEGAIQLVESKRVIRIPPKKRR